MRDTCVRYFPTLDLCALSVRSFHKHPGDPQGFGAVFPDPSRPHDAPVQSRPPPSARPKDVSAAPQPWGEKLGFSIFDEDRFAASGRPAPGKLHRWPIGAVERTWGERYGVYWRRPTFGGGCGWEVSRVAVFASSHLERRRLMSSGKRRRLRAAGARAHDSAKRLITYFGGGLDDGRSLRSCGLREAARAFLQLFLSADATWVAAARSSGDPRWQCRGRLPMRCLER